MECVEPALDILDALSAVPEGRMALKDCPRTIPNVTQCCPLADESFRGMHVTGAVDVVDGVLDGSEECGPAAVEAGLTMKLLLVIQSGCAPELKQKAPALLKLCRLSYTDTLFISKFRLTRTIH